MKHHNSSHQSNSAWKIALILVFSFAQLGWMPGVVDRVQAAPQEPVPPAVPNAADPPVITIGGLGNAMIGSSISFTVTFDNNDPENEPGYGPFIEFELPTVGVDGNDGLAFVSASYLTSPIPAQNLFISTFDAGGNATHPLVRNASGAYINATGTAGDQLVVIRLPFGSFTKDQPPAVVSVTVQMSNLADLSTPLTVRARGGYQYSWSPLDDWCCDLIVPTLSGYTSDSVTPIVMTLSKSYTGPDNTSAETATGPNFTRQYTLSVDIAPGQTLTNLNLTDILPGNLQFVSVDSTTVNGVPVSTTAISTPSTSTPDGTLTRQFASVAVNAQMVFSFYVPRDDSVLARVIDPVTGNEILSCNNASTSGSWTPLDPRDSASAGTQTIDPLGCEHTLIDRSIATQKEVSYSGTLAPGTTLDYTIQVQVSDFFAFDGLSLTDVISDGQHFDAGFIPTMSVAGNGFGLGVANMSNYTVVSNKDLTDGPPPPPAENPATDGTTAVTFNVSSEVMARASSLPNGTSDEIAARNHALAGRLLGGCVPLAGIAGPDCGSYNDLGTTVTIVFHTVVDEIFTDVYPSGDWSVDQGDILRDRETVTGQLLTTDTFDSTGLPTMTDNATTSLTLGTGSLTKAIYAINGTACPRGPVDPVCPDGGPYQIKPGDTVTYRITYVMPTSDEENLEFTDYLPLPIFDATEITAFDNVGQSGHASVTPAAGQANFGSSDTFYDYSGISPTLTPNSTNNTVNFFYGDYDDPRDQSTTVDLLLTVTVSANPFADGLYLTNQVHGNEGSTNGGEVPADAIVQLVLTEPLLVSNKGIVATDNHNAAVTYLPSPPGPVAFNDPGTAGARWGGTITSALLAVNPIDSNITHVDAGDKVTFAIVIENQGSSTKGAFDITILDTLPAQVQIPAGGLNLRISNGDNSTSFAYHLPGGGAPTGDMDLFTTGIMIDDPDPQHGACQAETVGPGKNILIITYDLQLKDSVPPGTFVNTSTLTRYAGSEGGPNHVPSTPPQDTASATVNTSIAKTLLGTEIDNAVNSSTQAVIGELATYQLVVTVSEGTVPAAQVVDTLDAGLAFVDLTSIVVSDPDTDGAGADTGLSSSAMTFNAGGNCTNCTAGTTVGVSNPLVTNSGGTITFNLGDLTNTDRNNSIAETITIIYRVVVLNVSGNQSGTPLNNSAVYSWTGGSQTVSAPDVTIIRPNVGISKAISPSIGDAGDSFTYTIALSGATVTDAFDVTLDDVFPTLMENMLLISVTDSLGAGGVTLANFSLTGNNLIGYTLSTVTLWDMPYSATRTITLNFTGTISYLANPGQQIDNIATVRWTSLQDMPVPHTYPRSTYNSNSTERTGAQGPLGALNNYAAANTANAARFTVNLTGATKYVVQTSEASTPDNTNPWYVAIGEVVRYRLVIPVPEGTSPNFQVRDNLPAGTTFLGDGTGAADADGTAKISFVSNGVGFSSSAYNSVQAISGPCRVIGNSADANFPARPLLCVLGDSNIGSDNSTTIEPDSFGTGTPVWFKLGTLTNKSNDADTEYVVIEFNALVDNTSAGSNDAGDTLDDTFEVFINSIKVGPTSNTASVRVAEPSITNLVKTATPNTGDAGDTITYQLTFSNAGGASNTTAFDLQLTDTVPAKMTANLGGMTVSSTGNCATGIDTSHNSGNSVDVRIAAVPAGCAVTATYTATLDVTVNPSEVLTNTANLSYTSLPGPQGTTGNITGSNTPGTSGTDTGERDGSDGARIWNDYHLQSIASVTVPAVARAKTLVDTEVNITGNNNTQATLGEIVTYQLVITVPEGTTPNLQVVDTLGLNMAVTDVCVSGYPAAASPISASAALTTSLAGGFADACNDGTLITSNPMISAFGGTNGRRITWQLGTITNTDTINANPETITITYQAVMLNEAANQAGTTRSNSAVVSWTGIALGAVTTNVGIVEATVNTGKSVSAGPYDAGDKVTYTITLTNPAAGSTNAFDTTLNDPLSAYISAASITGVSGGGFAPLDFSVTGCPGACVLQNAAPAGIDIPANTVVTIILDATLSATVPAGQIVGNTATTHWTSLNGVVGDRSTYNTNSEERDGTGGLLGGGALNDYRTQGAVNLTVVTPTIAKQAPIPTRYGIGATVTYPIQVTLPEGVTRSLRVIDQVPAGMIYVTSSVDASSFAGTVTTSPTISPASPADGDDITFTFGDTTTTDDNNGTNNSFILNVTLRVLDVPANQIGTTLTNGAVLRYINPNTGADAPDVSGGTQAITVAEPRIVTTKDTVPTPLTGVEAGDVLTYRVLFTNTNNPLTDVSTAYEVSATDSLAQGMTFTSLTSCLLDSPSTDLTASTTVDTSIPGQVTFSGMAWDIPAGSTITCLYTATAQSSLYLDGSHVNSVDADWTSSNGVDSNERIYDDSVSRTVDGTQDTDTASFSSDAPTVAKDDGGVTQVVVGDTITFTLTIGGPIGTLRSAVVTDHLPAGLIYNNDAVITGLPSVVPTVSVPNDGTAAVTLTWTFGDASKSLASAAIVYSARVADTSAVVIGGTLLNNVWLDHNYADNTAAPRLTSSASSTVTEPVIATTKDVAPLAGVQAGDTLTYTVRFTNIGTSTAFEVSALDTLTQGVAFDSGDTIACTYNYFGTGSGSIPVTLINGGTTLNLTGTPADAWDIPATNPDSYIECTYTLTAQPSLLLDGNHVNTIDADWTSLNGSAANERNYNDSVNRPGVDGTQDTDTATFSTDAAGISKSDSGVTQAVIGQTVHITLTINVTPGTLQDTQVVDSLPAGLIYSTGSQSVSANLTPGSGALGFSVSAPNDGTAPVTLTWDFADATVSSSPVFIQYDAIVANVVGTPPAGNNVDGTNLVNQVHLYYTDISGTPQDKSASDSFSIVEPVLSINKMVNDLFPGPGQVLTFTLTVQFTGASTADAFDVLLEDILPPALIYQPGTLTHVSGVAPNWASDPLHTLDDTGAPTLRIHWDTFPGSPSAQSVIQFQATVSSSVSLGQLIDNTATLTWTSIPLGNPDERTGAGGSLNDYNASSSITLTADRRLIKTMVGHSLGSTSLPEVAIGEILTYQVLINVPTGTTNAATLTDTLDLGLAFVDCIVITPSSSVTTSIGGGFTGICQSPVVSAVGNPANPASDGRQVVFDFGNLINTIGAVGTVTVQYRVVVLDVIENQSGVGNLNNLAELSWNGGTLEIAEASVVSIVEPRLTLDKTADFTIAVPGTTITFTLTIGHDPINSTMDAYDVLLADVVPAGLTYVPGSLTYVSGIMPNSAIPPAPPPALDDTAAPILRVHYDVFPRVPLGTSVIQFQAVLGSVTPGDSVTNLASVEWTTLPGIPPSPPPPPILLVGQESQYNATSFERRYDPFRPADIYRVTSSATVGVPSLPKTGFAPDRFTDLPLQPANQSYQALGDLWLEIPALGVKIPIVGVPMNSNGWDLTWLGSQAGYLEGTAYPTWPGTTGITSHVYLANGKPGPFFNLHTMIWGQKIIVHMDGQQYVYEVREVRRVWPGNLSVLSHSDYPSLTLITCQGYNQAEDDYLYRVAVRAVLITILPEK